MASPRLKPRSDIGQHHLGKVMNEAQGHDSLSQLPVSTPPRIVAGSGAPPKMFGKKAANSPFGE